MEKGFQFATWNLLANYLEITHENHKKKKVDFVQMKEQFKKTAYFCGCKKQLNFNLYFSMNLALK